MMHGMAIWSFCRDDTPAAEWIRTFAADGFDAMSLLPSQLTKVSADERKAIVDVLDELSLKTTVHGNCTLTRADADCVVETLGERLLCLTVDRVYAEDSRGRLYDAGRIARTLETIRDATEGMAVRFGAEDFPLDAMALDFYGDELGNVLEHPRCGMLIDLGHMHMRLSASPYFRGMTMLDYVKRLPLNIIELHVHDNNGRKDQHAPLGQGTLPFGDAAEAFRSIGFDGVSTIEICPGLHGEEPAASRPLIPASFRMWRELLTGEDR